MTEMYAAVRDALLRSVVPTYQVEMKRAPNHPRPWYLPPLAPPSKAAGRAQMLRLAALVPGSVKGLDN
jgi:hypothetical protein